MIGEGRTAISPDSGPLRADRVRPEHPQAQTGSDRIGPDRPDQIRSNRIRPEWTRLDRIRSGRGGGARIGPDRAGACPRPADDDYLQPIRDALPDDLTHDVRTAAFGFIDDWAHVFSKGEFDMGRTNLIPHRIDKEGHKPFRQPLRRQSRVHEELIDAQVDEIF